MNPYNKYILPKITNAACSGSPTMKQRQKIVPLAYGNVLEVGVGSGLNFDFYDATKVDRLYALDPSEEMWALAKKQLDTSQIKIEFTKGYAEEIPLDSNSIDSIVITYTMCTIPDVEASLAEMRRVLKVHGELIFCEHGIAPDNSVRRWQNILNPIWKNVGGGCNLNRNIPELISDGGFKINNLETMYLPGFKPASYNFWGVAKPR